MGLDPRKLPAGIDPTYQQAQADPDTQHLDHQAEMMALLSGDLPFAQP